MDHTSRDSINVALYNQQIKDLDLLWCLFVCQLLNFDMSIKKHVNRWLPQCDFYASLGEKVQERVILRFQGLCSVRSGLYIFLHDFWGLYVIDIHMYTLIK